MTVQISSLANGLRVVTEEIPRVETVSCGVWVGAGTRHEPARHSGMAHLLEHMAFKGTERRHARQIAEEIEAVGGHLNAYTGREMTAYYAKVLKGNLGLALDILSDILQRSIFDATELERERGVIIQEIGQARDMPDDAVSDNFQEAAFPDQPMGRSILGTIESVGDMPREAIVDYMHSAYGADRMVLSAAGNLIHEDVVAQAEALFSGLPEKSAVDTVSACYQGGRRVEERELEQAHLLIGFEGVARTAPEFYATTMTNAVLGGGMSSRLFQEIRERRGLAYAVYSFASCHTDCGLVGVYAGCGPKDLDELVPALREELARLPKTVCEDEIERCRAQMRAGLLMAAESTGARCDQIARQTMLFGEPTPLEEQTARITAVSREDVVTAAESLFAGPPTVSLIGPDGAAGAVDAIVGELASL